MSSASPQLGVTARKFPFSVSTIANRAGLEADQQLSSSLPYSHGKIPSGLWDRPRSCLTACSSV
jgi:hypothetical protein